MFQNYLASVHSTIYYFIQQKYYWLKIAWDEVGLGTRLMNELFHGEMIYILRAERGGTGLFWS